MYIWVETRGRRFSLTGKMPPRSKLSKVEFVHCEVCGCRFSNKDQERHVDICQDGINIADLSHGFIKDGELHGLGVTVDGKVTIEPGRRQSGPPVSTDSTGGGQRLHRRSRRRPPPVESVVDQIYAVKPYAN